MAAATIVVLYRAVYGAQNYNKQVLIQGANDGEIREAEDRTGAKPEPISKIYIFPEKKQWKKYNFIWIPYPFDIVHFRPR